MPPNVIWAPQPGSQALFLACPVFECLYEGTRGPGKTDGLLMDFGQHVGQGFGAWWRGVLFRETYKQLDDIVERSHRWFPKIFPGSRFFESGRQGYTWRFPWGEKFLFRYMEKPRDYDNYHGHEYPWIGWEELTNWPDLKCYQLMKSCCRSSCPDPRMPRKYRGTANPHGVGHNVVKAYLVDPAPAGTIIRDKGGLERVRIHGHWSENKILLAAEPEYPARIAAAAGDPNRAKAWLNGSWDIVAGGMFDDLWTREVHVVKPFPIPTTWHIDRSFDWGSSKPFSVGWWAESDGTGDPQNGVPIVPRGTLFRVAEWYGWRVEDGEGQPNEGCKMLARDIAKGIIEREKEWGWIWENKRPVYPGPADSSIFDTQNGVCIAEDMEGEGVTWEKADKSPGSRKNGWERLRDKLSASLRPLLKTLPMEDPGFFVFETCTQFIRTVPVLPRHAVKTDDVNTDAEDHVGDDSRYRVLAPDRQWKFSKHEV